ncbi:rhodanese domain-containing protein CG4456-like [Schistocerca nitens]|uniref:rhodanese domain-containing protein CG4456-like n=1 Tax=Schistocerca nitens TaxID=7011 RepID=UPI0021182812|nr:rhodanese domain-containing protein CG4456-like [Schistocerca nitens]XP_049803944.1 rhodanese domain-containing protein CG4456-like [Schistocerca nitens]XP_049803945.1 rhodanese domain-containing protein CG4456-like [Schistocerca nitens]
MPTEIGPDHHLSYDDIVKLTKAKQIYLIDVREPQELKEAGELPESVNLPLKDVSKALGELSDSEFQKKYNATKPGLDAPLVFSCRAGGRSLKALQTALELGYTKAKHYKGGFMDWEQHTKSKNS